MRRLTLAFSLALFTTLLVATPALAGRLWCSRDPIVNVGGSNLQVWVSIPQEYVSLVNGPIDVTFETPAGIDRSVVLTDDGFNGYGEAVSFIDSSRQTLDPSGAFNVRVWVAVPIDVAQAGDDVRSSGIPMRVAIIEGDQAQVLYGWSSGTWITTRMNNGS